LAREVQIHHLAGHSDTRAREPADYELEIAGDDGESRPITFLRLYNEFMFADTDSTPVGAIAHLPLKPLVFLNACGSAHKDPRRVYSWPEWFLQTGHCAVIGPETLVPDDAAAQYACFFYEALFSQRTAGEALVLARRELLHQYGNPLGLLYVLYGDSSVSVDHPIPQEERDGGAEGSRPG
jgi:CHAT domain-containing protein